MGWWERGWGLMGVTVGWEPEVAVNIADNLDNLRSERYPGDLVHWLAYASGAPSTQSRRSTVFSSKRKYHVLFFKCC